MEFLLRNLASYGKLRSTPTRHKCVASPFYRLVVRLDIASCVIIQMRITLISPGIAPLMYVSRSGQRQSYNAAQVLLGLLPYIMPYQVTSYHQHSTNTNCGGIFYAALQFGLSSCTRMPTCLVLRQMLLGHCPLVIIVWHQLRMYMELDWCCVRRQVLTTSNRTKQCILCAFKQKWDDLPLGPLVDNRTIHLPTIPFLAIV